MIRPIVSQSLFESRNNLGNIIQHSTIHLPHYKDYFTHRESKTDII